MYDEKYETSILGVVERLEKGSPEVETQAERVASVMPSQGVARTKVIADVNLDKREAISHGQGNIILLAEVFDVEEEDFSILGLDGLPKDASVGADKEEQLGTSHAQDKENPGQGLPQEQQSSTSVGSSSISFLAVSAGKEDKASHPPSGKYRA